MPDSRPEARLLLRSQKNSVFQEIQELGLDATEFIWTQEDYSPGPQYYRFLVSRLTHQTTGFSFLFGFQANPRYDYHLAVYSPRTDGAGVETKSSRTWTEQFAVAKHWLSLVRREAVPDQWESLAEGSNFAKAAGDLPQPSSGFTADERARVALAVQGIEKHLFSTHQLDAQQREIVKERLQYLVDASRRLSRKDWSLVALGVLGNVVVGLALNPTAARGLFDLAGRVLHWVFAGPPAIP